jgi:hypothetical protein
VRDLGVLAVEDLGHFLERDAAGLDEEEDHEEDFEEEPALEARSSQLSYRQIRWAWSDVDARTQYME